MFSDNMLMTCSVEVFWSLAVSKHSCLIALPGFFTGVVTEKVS